MPTDPPTFLPNDLLRYHSRRVRMTPEGGEIVRRLYCEPYLSNPIVLETLLGNVTPNSRIKPANDPVYPHYYCMQAEVDQIAIEAIGASPSPKFTGGQHTVDVIQSALQIAENPCGSTADTNPAGAYITAVYRPLIIMDGLTSDLDPFDFVDPQFEPTTMTTLVGKDLQFMRRAIGISELLTSPVTNNPGAITETVWTFTIRRLMVPIIPRYTISKLTNHLNKADWTIGSVTFPAETVRYDSCEIVNRISSTGKIWHDILYRFSIRMLWDTIYNLTDDGDSDSGFSQSWVGWNHMLGNPGFGVAANVSNPGLQYYPVGWEDANYFLFSNFRLQYRYDSEVHAENGNAMTFDDLFRLTAT